MTSGEVPGNPRMDGRGTFAWPTTSMAPSMSGLQHTMTRLRNPTQALRHAPLSTNGRSLLWAHMPGFQEGQEVEVRVEHNMASFFVDNSLVRTHTLSPQFRCVLARLMIGGTVWDRGADRSAWTTCPSRGASSGAPMALTRWPPFCHRATNQQHDRKFLPNLGNKKKNLKSNIVDWTRPSAIQS